MLRTYAISALNTPPVVFILRNFLIMFYRRGDLAIFRASCVVDYSTALSTMVSLSILLSYHKAEISVVSAEKVFGIPLPSLVEYW